jgi:di/tricarboxylate transporter
VSHTTIGIAGTTVILAGGMIALSTAMVETGAAELGDYWKLGLPLLTLFGLVAVLLVPVFWSF